MNDLLNDMLSEMRKQTAMIEDIHTRICERFTTRAENKQFGKDFVQALKDCKDAEGYSAYDDLVSRIHELKQ